MGFGRKMKSRNDKILRIVLVFVLAGLVFGALYIYTYLPGPTQPSGPVEFSQSAKEEDELVVEKPKEPEKPQEEPLKEIIIPETLNLEVLFICQAPLGNWNPPFGDACEEANILMVHYYLEGEKSIEPEVAVKDIEDLVAFEVKTYGFYESTTAEQTAQLVRDYYGYKVDVYYDISLKDIKKELAKENLVIVPAAGRMLGNPYYTPPGPLYHMLLIKGYTEDQFIVNDVGTKRGADYTYSYQVLEGAIHDWNDGDVENGKSAMIVVQK